MTSRSRQVPPGQGLGKFVWGPYSTSPLPPPESSFLSIRTGVANRAEATSVRRPEMFFHQAVFFVPPGQ